MVEDTLQNEKYIQALKSLEKHGKVAEHHKVATTPEEIDLMKNTQVLVSKKVVTIPYKNNQYETIFPTKKYEGFLP